LSGFDPLQSEKNSHKSEQLLLIFDDVKRVPLLFGQHDENLVRLEKKLDVKLASRGNQVAITGNEENLELARLALKSLYDQLETADSLTPADIDASLRFASIGETSNGISKSRELRTKRKQISPRTPGQAEYLDLLASNEMVFCLGPAGTGKTYLAVAYAVSLFISGEVDRIILSRPAVEAGERLGFLPGDLKEKVDPYLRPLYDAMHDMLPGEMVTKKLESGEIEVAPLAFMRGRTLSNAFIILDEAQNTTAVQMKMFLTRLGEGSRMVVTGDLSQVDLPSGVRSGLRDAISTLDKIKGIGIKRLSAKDVVRHDLVGRIVQAYEARTKDQGNPYKTDE
jgi:phosphate starvation-inducible protein PhoH and related proteins